MNNNTNRNNNRRRGRGNRNQGGGGHQANRIDSRARGNAPQMLEKYKKLAQDAQHNGDRVQAEYYLQFADHYFRVLADNRTRQEEGRPARQRDDRDFEDGGDESDFDDRRAMQSSNRRPRDRDDSREDRPREDRPRRENRDTARETGRDRSRDDDAADGGTEFEPAENPFVRASGDEERPRRAARPRRAEAKSAPRQPEFDAAVLPPAIGAREEAANEAGGEAGEDRPAPRRRRRKPDEDGAISAVG